MSRIYRVSASALFACSCFLASAQSDKKIVFVAGPKDHGRPERHEYGRDLEALKYCLDHASNLKGVSTVMYNGQVPAISEIKNAAVIVLESSGDRIEKETHALFPQDAKTDHQSYDAATTERMNQFDRLMKNGMGLVVLHYATWVDNEAGRKYFLDWVGGYHEKDVSKVLVNNWAVAPAGGGSHPILKGITPWSYEEEFYYLERLPEDPRRTPLLTATLTSGGEPNVVSWAVERSGGGRGFVFTGMDFHRNLAIEQHRRILANGIIWAAKLSVPAGGVSCEIPSVMKSGTGVSERSAEPPRP
jgi:type 1 glutamine amidotransferase